VTNKVQIDSPPLSGVVAAGTTSASASVPVNTELLALTATVATHFRVGVGAQTATVTDPMITPGADPFIIKLMADQVYTIAAIADSTAGNLSFYRVAEA
jgi:hypothetical protein